MADEMRVVHSNDAIFGPQIEITAPEKVEVILDHTRSVLWINVDGVCRLRIAKITDITWDIGDGNTFRTAGGYDQSG